VKIFMITTAAVVLLMLAAMLLSGGEHGPGRHSGDALLGGEAVVPSRVAAQAFGTDATAGNR
jgi:hypothetical protein